MGQVFSATGKVVEIAAWPVTLMNDLENNPIPAAGAAVVSGGVVYYGFGNPIELVREMHIPTLAFAYVAIGASYVVTEEILEKVMKPKGQP